MDHLLSFTLPCPVSFALHPWAIIQADKQVPVWLGHWDRFAHLSFGNQRCSLLQSTVESHTRRTR